MQKLSQTIKDAIYCTKRLGIKFLWVDALCIMQDSDEGKAKEITDMRYIFENSRVTIVAANSSSASTRFLGDRPPPGPRFRIPFPCPDGRTGTVSLRHKGRKAYYGASKEPINLRAWKLQETLLSRRVLFCASYTLQYQCQTPVLNLRNSLFSLAGQDRLPSYFFAPREPQLRLTPVRLLGVLNQWASVLAAYTRRSMTNTEDKLIALAGIAEFFSNLLRTPYVAGLWEAHVFWQIKWRASTECLKPQPKFYRAPSWSWDSIDSQLWYNPASDRIPYRCTVLECTTTLLSQSITFGAVTAGQLRLRGSLKVVWFKPPQLNPVGRESDIGRQEIRRRTGRTIRRRLEQWERNRSRTTPRPLWAIRYF